MILKRQKPLNDPHDAQRLLKGKIRNRMVYALPIREKVVVTSVWGRKGGCASREANRMALREY